MNKNWTISALAFMFFIPVVTAIPSTGINFLDQILGPFGNINVASSYIEHSAFIDAVLYFILFIGLAQAALGEKFKDHKIIPTVLGIMLAVGMTIFELNTHWNLGLLSGYAVLIFFGLLIAGPYILMKKWGAESFYAFCISYLFTFSIINGMGLLTSSEFTKILGESNILSTLMWMLYLISIIGAIIGIFRLFKRKRSGELDIQSAKNDFGDYNKNADNAFKKTKKAENDFAKLDTQMSAFENQLGEADNIIQNIQNMNLQERDQQISLLDKLQIAMAGTEKLQAAIRQMYQQIANSGQNAETIQQYMTRLQEFINRIREILIRLDQGMKKSKELDAKQLDIENNVVNYVKNLTVDNSKISNINKDFEYIKNIDMNAFAELETKVNDIKKKIEDSTILSNNLTTILNKDILVTIENLDAQSKVIIDKMIKNVDDTNLYKLSFQAFSRLFETKFIKDQTLAEIRGQIPILQSNIQKIIDLKKQLDEAFNGKNDIIKDKYLVLQKQILRDVQNMIQKTSELSLKDFMDKEAQFVNIAKPFVEILEELLNTKDTPSAEKKLVNIHSKIASMSNADRKGPIVKNLELYLKAADKVIKGKNFIDSTKNEINNTPRTELESIIHNLKHQLEEMERIKNLDKKNVEEAKNIYGIKGTI